MSFVMLQPLATSLFVSADLMTAQRLTLKPGYLKAPGSEHAQCPPSSPSLSHRASVV